MKVSADKTEILEKLIQWYKDSQKRQYITLGGYAGTGKTTLISIFRSAIENINPGARVGFISYTGKATRVLQNKLCNSKVISSGDSISTIHSLIYSPIINNKKEIVGWERKEKIDRDLLIIDESSMINKEIWKDLISYGIPILAAGDHGQLPPIEGKFNLMEKPDLTLTKIHRQVKGNPIIRVAQIARETGKIPVTQFGENVIKMDRTSWETQEKFNQLLEEYDDNTIILCGYNNTRVRINSQIRQFLGYDTPYPEPGDRVICLRNNHMKKIYNGMLGQIVRIEPYDDDWYFAKIDMEDGFPFEDLIAREQFNEPRAINFSKKRKEFMKGDLFDFGYAMTVHKAQGSQAKRVILIEERFKRMDEESWKRWLYTGVTRAEEELFISGDNPGLKQERSFD